MQEAEADTRPATRRSLEELYADCRLVRPLRRAAYDAGDRLEYEVTGVAPARGGRVVAEVESFVGGGFAGQVYRVRLLEVTGEAGGIAGLEVGRHYAVKILIPPSGFARLFRNLLYFAGYQCGFSAQLLPEAVRTGVLWQKVIRRAAALRFGDPEAVCDTHATFFDAELGSYGEINEWIEGRIWAFEADDRLPARWQFSGAPGAGHNSPEYVHKKLFMRRLVELLGEMGAPELARQYEWGTCKSQPNVLKRLAAEGSPEAGLTAVDFRAGLTLLCFLPMSPADVFLILRGLVRGRLVQFDRCDTRRLRRFVDAHGGFEDLEPALAELERQDAAYRAAQPDLTRHLLRLLWDRGLRRSIRAATITAWRSRGLLDAAHEARLRDRRAPFAGLYLISLLPVLGGRIVGWWGNARRRRHLRSCLTSAGYLARALRGARIEALIGWDRARRVAARRALGLARRPLRFWAERLALGWLPPSWHRFAAEPAWAWQRLRQSFGYALRFLRRPEFRQQVLLDQVRMGRQEGMLSDAEAARIESQISDPFIQKYLRCLAVHLCTVPVTQVVMVLVGAGVAIYCLVYRQLSWPESMGYAAAAAAAIQLLPISPGSITRGVFVLFLMVRERDLRNYWVAAPISFLHVVGYLAFPLQMVTHNPALARFLAGRWARRLANVVPVFGERGALFEHATFDLCFNLPISLARGLRERPWRWVAGLLAALLTVAGLLLGTGGLIWEARQPEVRLTGVTVTSAEPYRLRGGDLGWSRNGTRVHLAGVEGAVDFPARRWSRDVGAGDAVDLVARRNLLGGYDGLAIVRRDGAEPDRPPRPDRAPSAGP